MLTDRCNSHTLRADERPRALYEYYVTGTGVFPIDMLRHDSAWPATGEDAAAIEWGFTERIPRRTVKLRSYREPTVARWSSFTWSVSAIKPEFDR